MAKRSCPTCGAAARDGVYCAICGGRLPEQGRRFETGGRAARQLRSWAGFASEWIRSWSGVGLELQHVRRELGRLRTQRAECLLALGEAAYSRDEESVERLRGEIETVDTRIAELETASARAVEGFHRHVEDERVSLRPTEVAAGPVDEPGSR